MQRKIGYGLVGASLAVLFFGGVGLIWQASVQATEPMQMRDTFSVLLIGDELAEQEIFLATNLPLVSASAEEESQFVDEQNPTLSTLPQDTDDARLVLAALQFLADQEQTKIPFTNAEWHHVEWSTWWPPVSSVMNSGAGIQVESEKLIVADSSDSTFLRYGPNGEVVEAVSVYRDAATNEIRQFAFLKDGSWVNVTLRDMGFASNEFVIPMNGNDFGQFPTANLLQELTALFQQAPKQTQLWAYQQDDQFVIHQLFTYDAPQQFAQPADLVLASEKIITFDAKTGQLLEVQGLSHLENGSLELIYRTILLQQHTIVVLPNDVNVLYEANQDK